MPFNQPINGKELTRNVNQQMCPVRLGEGMTEVPLNYLFLNMSGGQYQTDYRLYCLITGGRNWYFSASIHNA